MSRLLERLERWGVRLYCADDWAAYAELIPPRPGSTADPIARVFGKFDRKEPIKDYVMLSNYFGERFPVLVLSVPVPDGATLAVTYRDTQGDVGITSGDTLRLKLIKPPLDLLPADSANTARYSEDPRVSPLAAWTAKDVWTYAREHDIALLPLYDLGYTSIGCEPCTSFPVDPANPRSGRWGGQKLECGIHIQAK